MKCVIAAQMSYHLCEEVFEKPLNPILGETFQCVGQDGAQMYFEQTSHHPPRSHLLFEHPDGNYVVNGWFEFAVSSGPLSADLTTCGYNQVTFKDGGQIKYSHNNDTYYGAFMGSFGHGYTGKVVFIDK